MEINYDKKKFVSVVNTNNGEVGSKTVFHYRQKNNIVWAEYSGGAILKGFLIAKILDDTSLDMRYEHINTNGNLMTGICISTPEILLDGRIRLHEKWQWTSGDLSLGESIIEEFIQ